jgi:hypothetical protein
VDQPEDVSGRGGEDRGPGQGGELAAGVLRLREGEAVDLDLPRLALEQLPAHGHADHAAPSQNKDLPILDVQSVSFEIE